ncbi:hypothetical protein [Anaerophilus nitritogenes]|uniref:hypothetical protein n=1 Tax=Anaerophilus nitritogenes TaxID=2498136 RepID=UPI00101D285C|nr:hypothetical protein [Anaerophilus nitritogenes]
MYNSMGNVPNLKNSNAIDQSEIQKVKNNMSNYSQGSNMMSSGMNMTSSTMGMAYGNTTSLSNSNNIDQLEVQQAREKVQNSGMQNTTY